MIAESRTSPNAAGREPRDSANGYNGSPGDGESAESYDAIFAELLAQGATFFAAKRDLWQLRLRTLVMAVAVGFLAIVAVVSAVAAAAVLLVVGAAGGLAAAFELPLWAGQLITSAAFVVIVAISIYMALTYLRLSSFQRTITRYERRRKPNFTADQRAPSSASSPTR